MLNELFKDFDKALEADGLKEEAEREAVLERLHEELTNLFPVTVDIDSETHTRQADVLQLCAAVGGDHPELRSRAQAVIDAGDPLYPRDLALTGQDVMRILGVSEGRRVGEALAELLEKVIEDPSTNDPDALEKLLR